MRVRIAILLGVPIFFVLAMWGLIALAQDYHRHAFTVTAVAPIAVTDMSKGTGFVVGTDGVARTCPDVKNVGKYIKPEGKNAPLIFQQIVPASTNVVSTPEHGYTLACLKVE